MHANSLVNQLLSICDNSPRATIFKILQYFRISWWCRCRTSDYSNDSQCTRDVRVDTWLFKLNTDECNSQIVKCT